MTEISDYPSVNGTIADYYNEFVWSQLDDYCFGSLRVENAIQFAIEQITPNARVILDIGCGIGWSTMEFAKHFPEATVYGFDLSPKLIETAQQLGSMSNAKFLQQDVTDWVPEDFKAVDAVVMLDVYEHIPAADRQVFHQALRRLLAHDGHLLLTCPTIEKQEFLRERYPERLQPVDENIGRKEAEQLADDVGGYVVEYTELSLWQPRDYSRIVIEREPATRLTDADPCRPVQLESLSSRRERVRDRLGLVTVARGIYAKDDSQRKICVASRRVDFLQYSVLKKLSASTTDLPILLTGDNLDVNPEGHWMLERSRISRACHKILNACGLWNDSDFQSGRIAKWVASEGIQCLVCSSVRDARDLLGVSQRARLPLLLNVCREERVEEFRELVSLLESRHDFQVPFLTLSNSRIVNRELESLGLSPHSIHYHAPVPWLSFDNISDEPSPSLSFIYHARYDRNCLSHLIVSAFCRFCSERGDGRLSIFGNGVLRESCEKLATAMAMSSQIRFFDDASSSAARTLIRSADVVIEDRIPCKNTIRPFSEFAAVSWSLGLPLLLPAGSATQEMQDLGIELCEFEVNRVEDIAAAFVRARDKCSLASRPNQPRSVETSLTPANALSNAISNAVSSAD